MVACGDRRRQRLVGAAGEQRHPRPCARRSPDRRRGSVMAPGARSGASRAAAASGFNPMRGEQRRERLAEHARHHRHAKPARIRHDVGEEQPHQPVEQRPRVGFLDMRAGVIDQMHVVHARRAGRHAGEARQAAVDVRDDLGGRRRVVLQHLLDQVDAPARRIELVAEQHIGRAGRGAEAAMHAGAQNLVRLRDVRIGELGEARSWSASHARPHAAGVEHALGIEAFLDAPGDARRARRAAARTRRPRRAVAARRANERGMAAGRAPRRGGSCAAPASCDGGSAIQIRPPAQS